MWVRGHSRSLKIVPFESFGTVSYSPSIGTMAISLAISEIISVKQLSDLEIWVWGHSRSLKLMPFKSLGAVSYSPSIITMPSARYSDLLVENREIFIPHLYSATPRGWPRRNFVKMFDAGKTRMIGLPYGEKKLWQYVKPFSSNTAYIWPIPKVPAPSGHADFCPISVTPVLTRVIEKIVVRQFLYPSFITPPRTLTFSANSPSDQPVQLWQRWSTSYIQSPSF